MGEQQIEVDRRLARRRIDRIRVELDAIRKQRATQRKERRKFGAPHAAIVGYTNAGKSTLLNRIAGSDVMEADMLFATLDPTTRRVELPDGQDLLLTDTVGFVRNLPHRLVEAFKATLEEAVLADFLIHVLDASEPEIDRLAGTTREVMTELGAGDKPVITVLNKVDRVEDPMVLTSLTTRFPDAVLLSARTGQGIEHLEQVFTDSLAARVSRELYRLPQSRGDLVTLLHDEGKVIRTEYEGNEVVIEALVSQALGGRLRDFRQSPSRSRPRDQARS